MNRLTRDLIAYIKANYFPDEKTKISKDGGETTFFRKNGKSLCYIETKGENSRVTVVIGESLNDKIESADISPKAKQIFKQSKQFHDGKWLFFAVKTKTDLEDIKKLLIIKKTPTNF